MPAENRSPRELVVWKYGTGHPIPPGAQYLHTEVEVIDTVDAFTGSGSVARLVWHYFLVDPRA